MLPHDHNCNVTNQYYSLPRAINPSNPQYDDFVRPSRKGVPFIRAHDAGTDSSSDEDGDVSRIGHSAQVVFIIASVSS